MARVTWDRFQWHSGENTYTFETSDGGLFATLTHVGGQAVTLPMVAWEGMLTCIEVERRARTKRPTDIPPRSGARWTDSESDRLAMAFREGRDIAAIARQHARTPASIETQLERLGLWNRLEHRPLALPDETERTAHFHSTTAEPGAGRAHPTRAATPEGATLRPASRADDVTAAAWQRWPDDVTTPMPRSAGR